MPKTQTTNLRLLKMIKRFPELYNSQHDLANDKTHSMVVWDTISYELDTPVSVLKKRWQKLRSTHRKKCGILKNGKTIPTLQRDDIFHLMHSMLDASGGDSPDDADDSSICSAPTLSIISEEGRSTRSSSSTSTMVPEVGTGSGLLGQKNIPELGIDCEKKIVSSRVLRSQNPRLRATRSGPPEIAKNSTISDNLTSGSTITASENAEKNFKLSKNYKQCCNESVKTFFQSMALTVSKFPKHIQAATKTKICNIVVEAELEFSPPEIR